jgi:hypothetical protein
MTTTRVKTFVNNNHLCVNNRDRDRDRDKVHNNVI